MLPSLGCFGRVTGVVFRRVTGFERTRSRREPGDGIAVLFSTSCGQSFELGSRGEGPANPGTPSAGREEADAPLENPARGEVPNTVCSAVEIDTRSSVPFAVTRAAKRERPESTGRFSGDSAAVECTFCFPGLNAIRGVRTNVGLRTGNFGGDEKPPTARRKKRLGTQAHRGRGEKLPRWSSVSRITQRQSSSSAYRGTAATGRKSRLLPRATGISALRTAERQRQSWALSPHQPPRKARLGDCVLLRGAGSTAAALA